MTEFAFMESFIAAGIGVLIGAYVIFGVLLALGIFALCRLAVLSKRLRDRKEESPEEKDCESCEKLKEKDQEIADLKEKVKDLESRPAPVVAVLNEERTLSESLAAASATGKNDMISKKSIIAYLSDKYGDAVELNGRANRTPNGKLLLSDNHFAFAPDGKRVCFVYVYETDEGSVLSLIRLDEPYVCDLLSDHPAVRRSAFPKNKAKDWYSVVADDTFTAESYYAVLDHAIALIRGSASAAKAIPEPVAEEPQEISLSESLAAAKEKGAIGLVTKKTIIAHLAETFGEKVELNGRANRTPNGKLLMSDNHFAFAPDGKRVCFTYIYEDDDGRITILLRTTAAHATDIRAAHPSTGARSAFPKNKERDWYSVVVDDSFTEAGVYAELDRAAMNIIGAEITPAPIAEEPQEISLSESLAAAKEKGAIGLITKKTIIAHLAETFGEKVELNGRANRTPNGKLLMSDNHFAFAPDGKRVCFTYIYEDDDGRITILLRTTAAHAADIRKDHPSTGVRSAFPKNKERDWYSVVVDDSFTEAGVYAELDRAAMNIIGAEAAPEPVAEEPQEISLSESLAAAKEKGAIGLVTKKSIIAHLAETFGEKVELNGRANRTPNGKLLMSDNHFAFAPDGKRVCFTYIYEDDDGRITILLRTTAAHATDIRAAHPSTGARSAFPKNKERDWYSVVVDDSFTEAGVYAELDRAAMNIIGTEAAPAPVAEEPVRESVAEAQRTEEGTDTAEKEIAATLAETVVTEEAKEEDQAQPAEPSESEKEEPAAPEAEPEPEPLPPERKEELSLNETLDAAKTSGAIGIVTKKSIFNHLAGEFEDRVELNGRENITENKVRILIADTHFAFNPKGKKICFTYVYEDDDGKVAILLRTTAEHAADIRAAHPATGARCLFPKNKDGDWYGIVVDNTFTEKQVYADLDRAVRYILEGIPTAAPIADQESPAEEISLKESLASAKESGVVGLTTKKSIIDYLTGKYGDNVEVNGRENRTPNGKLLLSDNHFALAEGKRVCFTYVYEDEGRITILLRLDASSAKAIRSAHHATGLRSAFPKNKDKDWYSVVVDDTFSKGDLQEILDESITYVLTK